jgi:hypothetical protein
MRRREFLSVPGGAAVTRPLAALAQQSSMPVIGLLGAAVPDDAEVARNLAAFRRGLAEAGYVEGQKVRIEYRWAEGHYERLPALAAELVVRHVDVIVNEGGAPSVLAAKNATSKIPIVFHTIDAAFATLDQLPADALIIGGDTFLTTRREQIIALAARHAIPAISSQGWFARAGGLLSYGPSLLAAYRRCASRKLVRSSRCKSGPS